MVLKIKFINIVGQSRRFPSRSAVVNEPEPQTTEPPTRPPPPQRRQRPGMSPSYANYL